MPRRLLKLRRFEQTAMALAPFVKARRNSYRIINNKPVVINRTARTAVHTSGE
jgi:hypothetical protein